MRAHLPIAIIHSIRIPTWHALFAVRGYPPGITPAIHLHAPIANALRCDDLPVPLARAIFAISAFITEAGRTDIYAAAHALGFPTRWLDASSPADLVAHLLASSATDAAVETLLLASKRLRDRHFRPISEYLFVGALAVAGAAEPVLVARAHTHAWREAFAVWSVGRDFGAVVAVFAYAVDGVLRFEIVHEDRVATHLVAGPASKTGEPTFDVTSFRPLRSHLVSYEPAKARLSVATDCTEAVVPLAQMAGDILFGDVRHFLDANGVDLRTFQRHGKDAIVDTLRGKVTSALAMHATWNSGKGHVLTPRGPDLFEVLDRYKIRTQGGKYEQITARVHFARPGGAPPECDASLRPPHHVTLSEPEAAPLVHELLDRARITNPAPLVRDLYWQQPCSASRVEWIAYVVLEAFEAMVRDGLLVASNENRSVAHPDHPNAGPIATAHEIEDGKFIAWSPDPTIAPFLVDASALVVYELKFDELAAAIAAALGLEGPSSGLDDDGLLCCGRRLLGAYPVVLFLLTRPPTALGIERLRDAAGTGKTVILSPDGYDPIRGLHRVVMPSPAGPWRPLLREIIHTLKYEAFVDTTLYAPPDARFVLHRATMRVWLDGILCVALTEAHFRLLEILIEYAGQPVYTKDIAERIAKKNRTDNTTSNAVMSLDKALEKSFREVKKKLPKGLATLIATPKYGWYQLTVNGFVD